MSQTSADFSMLANWMRDNPTCPACGHENSDWSPVNWSDGDEWESTCNSCGAVAVVKVDITYRFTTELAEQ